MKENYYGKLCMKMYEILHKDAPEEELNFYLSYAKKGTKILEPLCGTGRFLIPFLEKGFDISGIDLSEEMLDRLKQKAPNAEVFCTDLIAYSPEQLFDYIFIPAGSVSLFTDMGICRDILKKLRKLLAPAGKLVFSVDTMANRCPDDKDYHITASGITEEGLDLILKSKNTYDTESRTQFSPGIYELYRNGVLIQQEKMDFQTHLYEPGEMESYLKEAGFTSIRTYSSFRKDTAVTLASLMFLFECSLE